MGFLTNCRTCGKPVSSTAEMCPHCGERSPEPYKEKLKYSAIGLLGIIILAAAGYLLYLGIRLVL